MNVTFNTRIKKDGDKYPTTATISWDGVTDEMLRKLATKSIIIMAQSVYRSAENVPATDTINVVDLLKRERAARKPISVLDAMAKMSDTEYVALLIQLGVDDATAKRMAAKRTAPKT